MLQVVVSMRSLLQDRMAALNGRTVEYVLKQDKQAFIRLIGLSVAQVCALPLHQVTAVSLAGAGHQKRGSCIMTGSLCMPAFVDVCIGLPPEQARCR